MEIIKLKVTNFKPNIKILKNYIINFEDIWIELFNLNIYIF